MSPSQGQDRATNARGLLAPHCLSPQCAPLFSPGLPKSPLAGPPMSSPLRLAAYLHVADRARTQSGLNCVLPKIHVYPALPDMTSLGSKVFAHVIKVRRQVRPSRMRMGPQSNGSVLISTEKDTEAQRGDDVRVEAVVRGLPPQAKERLEPPAAGRAGEGPPIEPSEGAALLLALNQTLGFQD